MHSSIKYKSYDQFRRKMDSYYELPSKSERHRSKVDIVYDILVSAMGAGAKKTHILYKANISSTQVENYFSALLAHNLLERTIDIDENNIYRTTEKGMKFIECCEEIRSLIGLVM